MNWNISSLVHFVCAVFLAACSVSLDHEAYNYRIPSAVLELNDRDEKILLDLLKDFGREILSAPEVKETKEGREQFNRELLDYIAHPQERKNPLMQSDRFWSGKWPPLVIKRDQEAH